MTLCFLASSAAWTVVLPAALCSEARLGSVSGAPMCIRSSTVTWADSRIPGALCRHSRSRSSSNMLEVASSVRPKMDDGATLEVPS